MDRSVLSREQRIELSGAQLITKVRRARSSFKSFLLHIWSTDPTLQLEKFHDEAITAYTNSDNKYVYWEAPRGHAKSMITTAFVVWTLGRDSNQRIKIICANDKEARKRLYEIKTQIETNPLLQLCFPHLKKPKGATEWNKSRIIIERDKASKDPSIEAMGIMSGALGSRATLIVLDDIVDLRNAVLNPKLKEQVKQKLFGEIVPLLEPEGIIRAVGTPWTTSDVNAILKESPGWKTVGPHHVGTIERSNSNDPLAQFVDKFTPIWPYKFNRKALIQLHGVLGPAEYARAYLCQALTGDTVPIQGQWIKYYNARILGDPYRLQCFNIYDLAIEQTDKNDYFACVTILFNLERKYIFIVDAWHNRLTFKNQAKSVIEEAKNWSPQDIVIENGGYQGSLSSFLREDTKRPLPIYPFHNRNRSKERKTIEAQPFFEKGLVWFHPKFHPTKNPDLATETPIIEEITSFPFGRNDDLHDAVIMGLLTILECNPDMFGDEDVDEEPFEIGENLQMRISIH